MHNHTTTYPETHPVHHKLTVDDKLDIKAISTAGATSDNIINKLQSTNPDHVFIHQDIYNTHMNIHQKILGPHTPTQVLMEKLDKKNDFYLDFQKDDGFKLTQLFYNYRKS